MSKKIQLSPRKKDEQIAAYVFSVPAVFLLVAFMVVPMI